MPTGWIWRGRPWHGWGGRVRGGGLALPLATGQAACLIVPADFRRWAILAVALSRSKSYHACIILHHLNKPQSKPTQQPTPPLCLFSSQLFWSTTASTTRPLLVENEQRPPLSEEKLENLVLVADYAQTASQDQPPISPQCQLASKISWGAGQCLYKHCSYFPVLWTRQNKNRAQQLSKAFESALQTLLPCLWFDPLNCESYESEKIPISKVLNSCTECWCALFLSLASKLTSKQPAAMHAKTEIKQSH